MAPALLTDADMKLLACALFPAALAVSICGCAIGVEPGEPPMAVAPRLGGSVTVTWLIDGSNDPAACARSGAVDLEVVVYDESGQPFTRATAPCDSFSVTIPLSEGTYTADVTLVDPTGNSASPTKRLYALDVIAGTDLQVTVGF